MEEGLGDLRYVDNLLLPRPKQLYRRRESEKFHPEAFELGRIIFFGGREEHQINIFIFNVCLA